MRRASSRIHGSGTLGGPGCRAPAEPYPYPGVGSACPETRRDARDAFVRHRSRPAACRSASRPAADGHNFALLCRHGTRVTLVILPERAATTAARRDSPRPAEEPHRRPLAHPRRRACRDTFCYGWRVDGPRGPRHAVRPDAPPARPGRDDALRRRRRGPARARPIPQRTSRRSLFHRGRRYDWERRRPAAHAARRLAHLRGARPRLHLPPVEQGRRTPAPSAG